MFERTGAIVAAMMLAACGVPGPRPSPPHVPAGGTVPAAAPAPAKGGSYRIDATQSELRVLVYRAGPMASLGHNHVIVNRAIGGWVQYGGTSPGGSFALNIPAAGFVIDDAHDRGEEGGDFAADVPEQAKTATLHNMLSPAVLDAEQFPSIAVRSVAVEGTGDALRATLAVELAGHSSTLVVPFHFDGGADRLTGSGSFTLRQSALGLASFSVLMGVLRVQDDMRVTFKMVALAN